jgi:hypothetical protein
MIAKRYMALSMVPLGMLLLGFAALGAPEPWRGPLIAAQPAGQAANAGFAVLSQPLYLADALGLVLLALAMLEVWVIGITWEYRRHRR